MTLQAAESGRPDAPTIVFLHGLGVSSWMWTEQIAALSGEYHCLAIDLPGNGESYQAEWRSFADSAAQVAALIRERAQGGKAHVVGLSLGGYTALTLLRDHPEVVATMIVSGVTTQPFPNQMRWKLLVRAMPFLLHSDPVIALAGRMMQLPPEARVLYQRDSKRVSAQTFHRVYHEVLPFSLLEMFPQPPTVRLLAVAGDKEAGLIRNGLAEFNQVNGSGCVQAAFVKDAHHGWNAEHPQVFTDMIRTWITQRQLPTALQMA